MTRMMYTAVRLGPDRNPSRGTPIASAPATDEGKVPQEIADLWKAGEIAICVSMPQKPTRKLAQQSLAEVRKKRLQRRLRKAAPLFAEQLEKEEIAKNADFYKGR